MHQVEAAILQVDNPELAQRVQEANDREHEMELQRRLEELNRLKNEYETLIMEVKQQSTIEEKPQELKDIRV